MREELIKRILDFFGKGKTLIVYGPKNQRKEKFVFYDLKNEILKSGYSCVDTAGFSYDMLLDYLSNPQNKITFGKSHTVLLIHSDLFDKNPIPIIDFGAGRHDIEIIASSNFDINYSLGREATNARGRYTCFYFPTFLFEDLKSKFVDENFNGSFWYGEDNFRYKCRNLKEKYIVDALLSFNTHPCSFHDIQKRLIDYYNCSLSIPTISNRVFQLCKKCIFLSVERMDIKTLSILGGKRTYIPCSFSMYQWENIIKMDFKDLAFSFSYIKMKYDGLDFYRGTYVYQTFVEKIRGFTQMDDFAIMYKNNVPFMVSFVEHISQDYLNAILKIKTNMIKVIVCNDPYPKYFIESGIIIYTFNDFVKKGFVLNGI